MTMYQLNKDIGIKARVKLAFWTLFMEIKENGVFHSTLLYLYNTYKWAKYEDWCLFKEKGFHMIDKKGRDFAKTDEGKKWIRDFDNKIDDFFKKKGS